MKFGAHYLPTYMPELDGPTTEYYRRMFEQMEEVERLGYDYIWITEHHFSYYGGTIPHPPTFLAAIARTTRRIRLGVAISVLPLHNPLEVAESYAMADIISNGRLEFGVGKGSEPIEYRRMGALQQEATQRMKEGTEVIRQAWSDKPVNFRGEFFRWENLQVLPKPAQRPHPPIWVGCARTEDSFRWAGENGFNLMTLPHLYRTADVTPGLLPKFVGAYREGLARAGHDLATRNVLGKFHIYVSETFERAVREATPYLHNYRDVHEAGDPGKKQAFLSAAGIASQIEQGLVVAGDPQRCIDTIRGWKEEVGLNTLSGTFHFGGMPQELALKNLRLFAERVMPAFR